jgi:hypothetical protein
VALGQGFSEYFAFPYQFSFRPLHIDHHISSEAGTIGQLVADKLSKADSISSVYGLTHNQEQAGLEVTV